MSKVSWLKRLSRFFAGERSTLAARLAEEAFPRLYPIQLEDRQVLDGAPLVQLDAQGMVTVGAGAAANDGQADTFEATRVETDAGAMLIIKVNEQTAAEFRFDDVRQLRVEGSQDEDTLVLDAQAVPIGGVEFLGNAIPGSDLLAGGAAGPDRLIIRGLGPFDASPSNSTGPAPGGSGPTANSTVSLTYQLDTTTSMAATADGSWQVAFQGVEHVIDQLSVDDRQIIVAAGLNADLRGGGEHGTGWTTVEVVGGPILEMRNSLESLGVTATNVTVSGNVDLSGADARLTASESLTVAASGQLLSGGGNLELSAPQMLIAGVVDVGAGGSARLDVGSTGLMIVSGTIRAAGEGTDETGGFISLRGDFVRLLPTARLDATGSAGGGQILVGSTGDVSVDPELGSRGVWIEAGVVIDASALRAGDGGRVIVWGTEGIVVDGLLRATGGSESGDGGFVETSTRGGFSLTAAPVVTAPMGQGGTWLIDPRDLEIVATPGDAGFTATGTSPSFTFTSAPSNSQLGIATLLAAMGNGITVELKTGTGSAAPGDITLSTDIDFDGKGTGTLIFTAHHSIILNGKIFDSNLASPDALSVVLTAGTDGLGTSSTSINADVATQGGTFTATGDNFTLAATKSIQTLGGATSVTTTAGKVITINGTLDVGAGSLNLTADDLVLAGGPNSIVGTGVVTLQPLNPGATIGIGGGMGTFTLTNADLDSLADGFSQIVIGRANGTGGFNILATTFRDPVLLQSPTGGTINIDGTLTGIDNATLTIDGAGTTTVLSANVVTAGTAITFSDNVQVDAAVLVDSTNAGAVPVGAAINFMGTVDATAAMGAEALTVNAGSAGNVTFSAAVGGAQALDGLNVTGNLVTVGAIAMGAGPLTITANDVVLGGAADSIVGTGVVTLQPLDPATTIGIAGGTGSFNVTTAELGTLADGFSQIVIGRADGTGGINILASTFRDPVLLRSPTGGTINVDGAVTGTGDASFTFRGLTTLSANVVTAGATITFEDDVQVDAAVVVDSTNANAVPAGANIDFQGTVDATVAMGAESLTVNAGNLGDATFTGAVGSTEALDALDVTGDLVTVHAISMGAGALTLTANDVVLAGTPNSISGTGVVTLQPLDPATVIGISGGAGTFTLTATELAKLANGFSQIVIGRANGTGGINLNATTFRDPVLLRSPSGGAINVDATLTGTDNASITVQGFAVLSADVVTSGDPIKFENNVEIDDDVQVISNTGAPAGANIDFLGTVNAAAGAGSKTLTVKSGTTGDATFAAAVGDTRPLDELSVTSDVVSFASTVAVAGPLAVISSGATTFSGAVTTTTASGNVTLTNFGLLTIASGADFTLSGSFNQNGAGTVSLGADILTANKTINFSRPVTLTDNATLNSNNVAGTGANITLGGDVTGTNATQTLTLTAGSAGDISAKALGTGTGNQRLGGLVITSADDVTATSIATAGGLAVEVQTLKVTGAINSWGAPVTITTTHSGAGNALELAAVDTRGQDLTISSADSILFTGGANSVQSSTGGGSFTLQGTTVGTTIGLGTGAAGAVQLTDVAIAAIGPGFTGGIFFGRTGQTGQIALRGASHTYDQNVTIRADGGANVDMGATISTTEGGAVGKSFSILGAPTSVIVLDKNIVTAGGTITVAGVTRISDPVLVDSTNAGGAPTGADVLFQGTVTGAGVAATESLTVNAGTLGDVTFTGAVGSAPGFDGLSVTGDVVLFSSTVAVAGPLTVVSSGATTFTNTVTTTTANGNVLLTNAGLLTIPSGGNFTLSGTFTQNGTGSVSLGANVLTANKAISFSSPVTLTSNVVLNSNNAVGTGANITLGGAVAGTDATQTLTLVAGSAGDISAQALGTGTGLQRLGGLTITSADEVSASSIATAGGLTSTSNKLTVTGATDSWTAPVTITVNHAGPGNALQLAGVDTHGQNLTISSAGAIAFTGGSNSVQSSTSGGIFTLQGTTVATTLGLGSGAAGSVQLSDASIAAIGPGFTGGIVFGRAGQIGQITFSGPSHNYDQNVTIRADGGAKVDLGAPINTTEGGAVNKSLTILGGPTSVIALDGNIVTAGGGIAVSGIMQISAAITVDSTNAGAVPNGANIDFQGTVNATPAFTTESLTVNAGAMGDVTFTSAVGNLQPLDALSVTGNDVLFSSTVAVAGPLAVVSSGATTFTSTVTTTGLTGNVILTNTGLLTIPSGGTFTLSGSFNQNGAGNVSLGANVLTANKTISFSSPVTLTSSVILNSNNIIGTGANITLGGDVVGTNATQTLTLVAGSGGDISAQVLGTGAGNERLGGLTITSANDVTATSIATAGGLTSTSNSLTVTGATDSWNAPVTITVTHAGPGNALQLAAVDTRGQDLTISSAGPIAFTGGLNSVQSSTSGGILTLQGTTVGTTLGLGTGAAGAVQMDDASIGAIGPGFTGGIFFGRTGQTGQIMLRGANHAYDQNVTIRASGGATVDLGSALSTTEGGADNKFVSIVGGAASLILLGGNISTDGGKITVTGNTLRVVGVVDRTLSTSLAVDPAATAGDIDLGGLTQILGSGGSRLLIDSRRGAISNAVADDGQVDLPATVGSAAAADSLGLLDVRTDTGKTILRNSGGASTIRVVGTAGSTSLFINGPVQLTGTTTITVTPGDADLSEAIFSSKGATPMSLAISTSDGGVQPDGVVRLGAMDAAGGSRVKDLTITTADGLSPPGMLMFDHPGTSPLAIDIAGNFTHTGQRVIVADDTSITTQGGNILLNGQIDASAPNIALVLDASMPTGGIVNPGEIGSFGGGNFLSEVQLITNNNSGRVILNDSITIDDPAAGTMTAGAGVVVVGRTEVASTVTIRSESGDDDAGAPINFANAIVYGDMAGRSLTLDSHSATSTAGQVSLGPVSNNGGTGSYLQSLLINSTGTGGGAPLQLSNNISLDNHGAIPALFQFQGGNVEITTAVIIDTEQGNNAAGGNIDLGTSRVSATTTNKTLTLDARGVATGGTIVLGGADSGGGKFLGGIALLTNGVGRIVPGDDLLVDATTAVFPERGVRIEGVVALPHAAGSTWMVDTEQGGDDSAAPINLDAAIIAADNGNVGVALNSSGSPAAAAITLGSFDPPAGLKRITSLTISAIGGASGDVTFNDVANVNGPISVTASSVISGDGQLVADDLTLAAGTGIYGDDATSPLKVQTPELDVRTTIGGDVRILNSFAGPVTLAAAQAAGSGSIDYQQTGLGSLNITGDMTTAGTGSIDIETDGAIHLAGATLRTEGTGTHISVSAGGALTETGGKIVVGNSNAATRAIVSTFPLDTNATAKDYNNGLNVDPLRNSQVTVTIVNAAPGDKGYTVDLDWGVPASIPNVQNDLSLTAPSQAYNHTYSAVVPIPPAIPVTVTVDMDSRIDLFANTNAVAQDLTTSTTVVVLNAEGTFFSFAQVIPGLVSSTPRVVVPLSLRPQLYAQPTVAPPVRVAESSTVSMSAQNVVDRQFVLRLVLPDDLAKNEKPPERNLGDEDLDDLPGLFKRLFDGRYQIWLKLEDGSEQLVKDFYIRDGKAIDLEDVAPDVADEVPAAKPEAPPRPAPAIDSPGEFERNASPSAPPLSPPARSESSPGIDREAAVDWSDRAREALGQVDEREFSKARRLLRRGSV